MIELHSQPTPNGQKLMIMLEETGLEWTHVDVNIRTGDQFTPGFMRWYEAMEARLARATAR